MGRRCCIVTCKNATIDDCDERVSFFKVPSDRCLLQRWLGAIESTGSKLSKASAVCERHFKEDEIRRMAVLRDSFGNVIFQRPLTKCSLTKNAVPTIFDDNQEAVRKIKKQRITKKPDESRNIETGSDASNDLAVTYGNILLTFPTQNNLMQLNLPSDDLHLGITETKNQDQSQKNLDNTYETVATNYVFNGLESLYPDGFSNVNFDKSDHSKSLDNPGEADITKSFISIILKPQDNVNNPDGPKDLNNIENINTNKVSELSDAAVVNKVQLISSDMNQLSDSYREINVETPKEITILVPESEYAMLNQNTEKKSEDSPKRKRKRKDVEVEPNEGTIHYPLPESDIQKNIRTFDIIFYHSHRIKLPSPMWGYHKNNEDKNVITFSKAKWFKDVLMPPNYEKQVVFHESDDIKIYINNKFSPLQVRRPSDMHEMELILKYVDEVVICAGGPDLNDVTVHQCAQKDYAVSRWRHRLCPIIVDSDEPICNFCTTINNENKANRYPKKKRLPFGRRRAVDDKS